MAARSPLRLLAPIAIAVVLLGVIVVVASSPGGSDTKPNAHSVGAPPRLGPRIYIVRQGDTLTAISAKTGITSERILALNPGIDPQALQPGRRLKLRP
jgi:N-acetylmuramoyl-L-alanine amidase